MSKTLTQHQHKGVEFLINRKKAILNDEMGTGKTLQAIVAGLKAIEHTNGKIAVVCPASLTQNWANEIKDYNKTINYHIIQTETETNPQNKTFYISSYEKLDALLNSDIEFEVVIVDESHYIKGKSQRTEKVLKLTQSAEYVFLLTGTMLLNRPIELFNQLKAIKHPLSAKKTVFAKRYCNAHWRYFKYPRRTKTGRLVNRYWDDTGASNTDELKMLIQPYVLRRTKDQVIDLPEKIRTKFYIDMSAEFKRKYALAWEEYQEEMEKRAQEIENIDEREKFINNIMSAKHAIELQKLQQVASLSKIDQIVEFAQNAIEQGEKVIIFAKFTKTIEELHKKIKNSVTLTGQTKDRQSVVDAIQQGDKDAIIMNIQAGGVGLTLTKASIVIFADFDWSPEIMKQAEDRAHRMGQTKTVNIYYFIAKDTVDEYIIDVLNQKSKIIDKIQ